MNTIHYNDTVQLQPCVATIGFFDGVHRGHQFLIHHLVETARKDGLQSTVITFDAHPRKVLQADYQPEMLSTLDSKLLLLSKTEVDNAVVLHFDKTMAAMSAREFMQQVLHDRPNVSKPAREKVEQALKEMNYQPNMYASALAYNKAYTF